MYNKCTINTTVGKGFDGMCQKPVHFQRSMLYGRASFKTNLQIHFYLQLRYYSAIALQL